MKQTFDTDDYLFGVLKASGTLTSALTGGIYTMGERPDNSDKEDVVVSTIALTQDIPQRGTSNVNIHVPDIDVTIRGIKQKKANRARLKALTTIVIDILNAESIAGLKWWLSLQSTIKENETNQHFTNLRVEWSIH